MGLFELKFQVVGEKQFDRAIRGLEDIPQDLSPVFEMISEDFRKTEAEQFEKEGSHEGNQKWADLSPKYAIVKAFKWGAVPILTASGKMRDSLTVKGAEGHVNDITAQVMTIGTDIGYAIFHQMGTYKMPARKPIELSDKQKTRWGRITRTALHDAINKNIAQPYKAVSM